MQTQWLEAISAQSHPLLETAKAEIETGQHSCVVIQNDAIVFRGEGRGVAPIKKLYENPETRPLLAGSIVTDKIIGKAAAVLLVLGAAKAVYGQTMSASAAGYLKAHGLPYSYATLVDHIQNRSGTGLCPLEQAVLNIEDPKQGYEAIAATVEKLMAQNNKPS